MDPFTLALVGAGINLGTNALSGWLGSKFAGDKPSLRDIDPPNIVNPILALLNQQRGALENALQYRLAQAQGAQRAAGGGSLLSGGAMQQIYGQSNDLRSRLDAIIADELSKARERQEALRYEHEVGILKQDINDYNSRAQAITNMIRSIGAGVADVTSAMGQSTPLSPELRAGQDATADAVASFGEGWNFEVPNVPLAPRIGYNQPEITLPSGAPMPAPAGVQVQFGAAPTADDRALIRRAYEGTTVVNPLLGLTSLYR